MLRSARKASKFLIRDADTGQWVLKVSNLSPYSMFISVCFVCVCVIHFSDVIVTLE